MLISGGEVIDGTGKCPPFHADVGIQDGRIVAVGAIDSSAQQTIDARGLAVTPGFVDIHTHYDGQATWDAMLAPSCFTGVTSLVFGNCGVGFAPVHSDKHEWLIGLLEGVEDIPGTALAEGLAWDWETFPQYLDALGRRKFSVDVGAQIPHAALRAYVMGDRGADPMAIAGADEQERMAALTTEALQAGALGFSTSRTMMHKSKDGLDIGTMRAPEVELLTIAAAIGRAGLGVIQLISDAYLLADEAFFRSEMAIVRRLAEVSGRAVSITVQQIEYLPDRWKEMLAAVHDMRRAGLLVSVQVAPRPIGAIFGFGTTMNPFFYTPCYQTLKDLPLADRVARLRDAQVRRQIMLEHATPITDNPFSAIAARRFDRMYRMSDPVDYEPREECSLMSEAAWHDRPVAEFAYDILLEEDGARLLYMPSLNYAHGNLDDVHAMMIDPWALYGLSDGGAHCGMVCDATFPATAIGFWAKGNRSGLKIPLETLVHGYSQRNAWHVGWRDRGVIARGYLADINIIDLANLALPPPAPVYDLPAGGMRLMQQPRGFRFTIKRGVISFQDGVSTNALAGELVRGRREVMQYNAPIHG